MMNSFLRILPICEDLKTALFHTIRLIDDYQDHCPGVYKDVEAELNDLKDRMQSVMKLLGEEKEVA